MVNGATTVVLPHAAENAQMYDYGLLIKYRVALAC